MKILIVGHDDMAGVGASLAKMLIEHGHTATSAANNVPFRYDTLEIPRDITTDTLAVLAAQADVIHVHSPDLGLKRSLYHSDWPLPIDLTPHLGRKRIIAHYHGTELRMYPKLRILHSDIHTVVSTPDLLKYAPEATWLPQPLDKSLLDQSSLCTHRPTYGPIIVCQAPSDPSKKHTDRLIKASWDARWYLLLARGNHAGVIRAMQVCDIVFDHLHEDYYGVAAVEGGILSKPVVRAMSEELLKRIPKECPFVSTTSDTLKDTLDNLACKGRQHLQELGEATKQWVRYTHYDLCYRALEQIYGM